MSIDLEERIRRAAQLLDEESLRVSRERPVITAQRRADDQRRPVVLRVAAVCLLLAGVAGMFWATSLDRAAAPGSDDTRTDAPGATLPGSTLAGTDVPADASVALPPPGSVPATVASNLLAPIATLAPMADVSAVVPPTVFGTSPTDWYRLQPDLDVAWYSDGGGTSMLCFRTPAGTDCQLDRFAPTGADGGPIGIHSIGGQLLVVTLDPGDVVSVGFDNGQVLTAPIERDPQIGWGVARIQLPDGVEPTGLAMVFGASVPAATVPDDIPATTAPADTAPPTTAPPVEFDPAPTTAAA